MQSHCKEEESGGVWEAHTQPNLTSETQRPRPEARVCPQVHPGVPHQAFPSTSKAPPSSSCVFLIAKSRPTTPHKLVCPGMMRFSTVMKDHQTLLERHPSPYRSLPYSLSLAALRLCGLMSGHKECPSFLCCLLSSYSHLRAAILDSKLQASL